MPLTIRRPDTAFSKSPITGKKRPREHDKAHLDFIRGLPCLITGKRPVEAAHIRYADARYGKLEVGGAEKPHDKYAVPLSPEKHAEQHQGNEKEFWAKAGIDPVQIAQSLWSNTGDDEVCEIIIRESQHAEGRT